MKKSSPSYPTEWYIPGNISAEIKAGKEMSVRKEYTRLRDIAQKRLKRLEAAGFENTNIYKRNVKHFPKLKDIKSSNELAQRLSDLEMFITSQRSTVSGMKSAINKALETFEEHGYDFVNKENIDQFGKFMEEYRNQKLDEEYDSGEAADSFRVLEKHHIDPKDVRDDFEYWLENSQTADTIRVFKDEYGSPAALKGRVERKKRRTKK